jgi:hypothetical protein
MRRFLPLLFLFFWACNPPDFIYEGPKMKGVSLVAPPQPIASESMEELEQLGMNWVSVMPYAFTRLGDTTLIYNAKQQWWGERNEGIRESVRLAQARGLRVMLKPHVWVGEGFHGDIQFTSEAEWQAWERAYSSYILHFAQLADSLQVPLFCIGTELKNHTLQRAHYWQALIVSVRAVYSGQLTYADNWDSYTLFPHWGQLDYIGVDAYFSLSTQEGPSLEALAEGWQPHVEEIRQLAARHQKPVLFTEWGFRSISGTAIEPWVSDTEGVPDEQAQEQAYRAFFQTVWPQPWLAGAFLWKWYPQLPRRRHRLETDYTPQGKSAQEVVREYYRGR